MKIAKQKKRQLNNLKNRLSGVRVCSGVRAGYGQLSSGPGQGYVSLWGTQH